MVVAVGVRLFSGRPEIVRDRLTVDQRAVQVDFEGVNDVGQECRAKRIRIGTLLTRRATSSRDVFSGLSLH